MKKNKHIFFLSFLLLCFSVTIAQEDVAEDNHAILNPAHQQFAGYSIFDSQPVYNSPWEWLHQTPQGNTLRWVKMWDANTWYAVGYGGVFMKTTDGGANWFITKDASGYDATGAPEILYDAWFFDMNTGIAVGGGGACVKTTDGGVTWDSLSFFPTAATCYDVYFVNDTLGFAVGTTSMRIYKTVNGGTSWTQAWGDLPSVTAYSVYASDENNIVMATASGNMRITTNGGVNWTLVNVGWTSTPYALRFSDPLNGWVSASAGNVAYTTNGGTSWTNAGPVPVTSALYDLDILTTMTQTLNEGFEDVTFPPAGWHTKNVLGGVVWMRANGGHSGAHSAVIAWQTTGGEDWLVTPQVPIVAGDSLTFWARKYFSSIYDPDTLQILVSVTDTAVASFTTEIFKQDVNAFPYPNYGKYSVDLSAYVGQSIYIAFRHYDVDGNGMYLDDVSIGEPMMDSQVFVTGDPFNIYTTTNMGVNWTPVPFLDPTQPWTSTFYSTDFIAPDNFVTVGGFGLINEVTPTDAATTYTNFIKAGILYDVWASSATGTVIAAGSASSTTTFDQAIYSTDGGETWAVSAMLDSADLDFNSLSMVSATTGYAACEDHRVMKTTNGGATWFKVTNPATSTNDLETVYFVDENIGYVFGAAGAGFKTTDGGTTWAPLTTTITGTIYGSHFLDAQTGFIVGASGNGRKTTDGGTTFTTMTTDMATSTIYSIYMVDANIGYLSGSTGKVRKTTDGGTTWTNVDVGNTSPALYQVEFRDENYGMTVGSVGRTFYTSNGGTSWIFENTSMSTIYGLSIEKTSADTSAAFVAGSNAFVMRNHKVIIPVELASFSASVNGDDVTLSWITATELNNSGFQVERKTDEENWVELGFVQGKGTTTETQVYTFIDKDLISGKYNYRIKQIDFNGSHKYYDLNEEVEIAAPISYNLSQNYPNPFNPTTKIKYSVPVEGFVNIAVFNILGEKVANLVNSIQKAGNYELSFDATNLSSGMYIYRMESGNYVSIKKMMILK